MPFLRDRVIGPPGTWRMFPTSANGQPAAVEYVRDEQGGFQPYGVVVLTITRAGIIRVTSFGDPHLVSVFDGKQCLLAGRHAMTEAEASAGPCHERLVFP